jgi:hypothetical protein
MMAEVFRWVPNGVARMAGNDPEMDRVARLLLFTVRARARKHRLTGEYLSKTYAKSVPGKKGVRDRMIFAGDKAAYSIEWGHTVRRADGTSYWLPGQHILGGAVSEIPGSWVRGRF